MGPNDFLASILLDKDVIKSQMTMMLFSVAVFLLVLVALHL